MKHLKRFNEKKELGTSIKVLDNIIDNDGKLANSKGHIINVRRGGKLVEIIIDKDWDYDTDRLKRNKEHEYIGGIDKNGFLVGFDFNEEHQLRNFDGRVVTDELGNPWVRNKDWRDETDTTPSIPEYSHISDTESSGWVNVKIDMEVIKKIKRFSKPLSNKGGLTGLREKLNKLNNPLGIRGSDNSNTTQVIQQKISSIMLLKYLHEMKDHFNATSAGFLFESFIGGLINGTVPDDNKKADVIGENGVDTYQIKFVDYGADKGNIKLVSKDKIDHRTLQEDQLCDYYIVALKQAYKVYVYVLNSSLPNTHPKSLGRYMIKSGISMSLLKSSNVVSILDLSDVENKIKSIGEDLSESLNDIWTNLSKIEYNIETITTGVDKNKNLISEEDFDGVFEDSNERLKVVSTSLKRLNGSFKENENKN
jgi:hypothetical protein